MKIQPTLVNLCVTGTLLAICTSAWAQGPGGGRRGGFGRGVSSLMLLQAEPVQKELELSDDQKSSLSKLADDTRAAAGELRNMSPDERRQRREETQKKVNDILQPKQQERLEEIVLQVAVKMQPAQALSDSKVADKLKLTDDQAKQLADLSSEYRQKFMDLMQAGGPPDRDAMGKLRGELTDKSMAVLTSDQKDQLAKMEGKTVDFDAAQLFRGFGRGGHNSGNGNGEKNGGGNDEKGGKNGNQPDA